MKSSLALLGLVGGAYFLTKKSPAKTTTEKKDTKLKDLPKVDDKEKEKEKEDEQEDCYPNCGDEEKEESEEETNSDGLDLMNEFYDPFLITNDTFPAKVNTKKIWISNDCLNWGIIKGYDFSLPEKYLYSKPVNPDKLTTPSQYWSKVGDDMSPAPVYIANIPVDVPSAAVAANMVDYYAPCNISPPRRAQFKTYGEYKLIRANFAETPLGKLFEYLNSTIRDLMYVSWEKQYPGEFDKGTGAAGEMLREWSLWAIENNPNLNDFSKLTDIAYAGMATTDPSIPKKIDPKKPEHKYFINIWTRINFEVKDLKGLIKQWGWN